MKRAKFHIPGNPADAGISAHFLTRVRTAIVRQIEAMHHTEAELANRFGLKCLLRNL
jgi:hypothetical protein